MPQSEKRIYDANFDLGRNNWQGLGMDLQVPVFPVAACLILLFIAGTLLAPDTAQQIFETSKNWVTQHFHWLFVLSANIFVLAFAAIGLSPLGRIRLGGNNAKPEFSYLSWLAMLFAAGMGIGLMFWSVAEPIAYYTNWAGSPLDVIPRTPAARELALASTMYHWGFHAWAIYGLVALSLGFFAFNKGLPLTMRSSFYPMLGNRVWGWPGHIIDIVAVLATLFGLATSLGFGAQQISAGLNLLFGIDDSITTQIFIILGVTLCATISVVRGLHGGVRLLSNINMLVALAFFIFVALVGGISQFWGNFIDLGHGYLSNVVQLSTWFARTDQTFYNDWTVFYWAWWIAWSPFVGLFIARVSKGRTVREFVTCVLLVPSLITALWLANFGGLALEQASTGVGELANGISSTSLSMFEMLEQLPLAQLTTPVAIVLVLIFFVTSSDSGSLVIDSITTGGKLDAPIPQRIFWAQLEGLVAIALLYGGGTQALGALQTATIVSALPFVIIIILMTGSLIKGLKDALPYC